MAVAAAALASSSGFFCTQRLAYAKHTPLRHVQVQQANNGQVVCMAHPRRVKMVAQQIKREIGDMLIKDKVIQHAILPETAVGADMYLSSLATVSDVVLSNDLQVPLLSLSCRIGLEKPWLKVLKCSHGISQEVLDILPGGKGAPFPLFFPNSFQHHELVQRRHCIPRCRQKCPYCGSSMSHMCTLLWCSGLAAEDDSFLLLYHC